MATWEALVIGLFSGTFCFLAMKIMERTTLDDPTGSFAIHGVGGIWGLIAAGIFAREDPRIDAAQYDGMLRGTYAQKWKCLNWKNSRNARQTFQECVIWYRDTSFLRANQLK